LAPAQRLFNAQVQVSKLDSEGDDSLVLNVVGVGAPVAVAMNATWSDFQRVALVNSAESRPASCTAGPPAVSFTSAPS